MDIINITAAIEKRQKEIKQLQSLRPKIERLIEDARAAESRKPCMPDAQWRELREEIEGELRELGLIYLVNSACGVGVAVVGEPAHWSTAKVV